MAKVTLRGKITALNVFTIQLRHSIWVHNYIHLSLRKKARYKTCIYQISALFKH